jgi:hypothetical protein
MPEGVYMFATPQARFLRKRFKKNRKIIGKTDLKKYTGANRRATAILPFPRVGKDTKFSYNIHSDYKRLLLSIEANQTSCCLHIASEKNKSRAAVLVYRGRALGSIYGNKTLGRYLFDRSAYERAFSDLVGIKHSLEAYPMSDELVLGAAALFHGYVVESDADGDARQSFTTAFNNLTKSAMPGCIVINGVKDRSLCFVYLHSGQISGIYSDKHGWLKPTQETAMDYIRRHRNLSIEACMLPLDEMPEIAELTFGLTGVDRFAKGGFLRSKFVIPNIFFLGTMDAVKCLKFATVIDFSRFFPRKGIKHPSMYQGKSGVYNHAYAVHP